MGNCKASDGKSESFVSGGFLAAGQKYWQGGQRRGESETQVADLAKIKGQDLEEHQQILVRRLPKGGDEHFLGRKLAVPRLILIKRGTTT